MTWRQHGHRHQERNPGVYLLILRHLGRTISARIQANAAQRYAQNLTRASPHASLGQLNKMGKASDASGHFRLLRSLADPAGEIGAHRLAVTKTQGEGGERQTAQIAQIFDADRAVWGAQQPARTMPAESVTRRAPAGRGAR